MKLPTYALVIPVAYGAYRIAKFNTKSVLAGVARSLTCLYTAILLGSLILSDRAGVLATLNLVGIGFPLPEKDYGDVCQVYTPEHPSGNAFYNVTDRFDIFVIAHSLGWFVKAFILRDLHVAWICSILFEIVELCFAHLLPNFNECWWDSIIFDVFGCNLVGIYGADQALSALGFEKFDFLKKSFKKSINFTYLFSAILMVLLITLIDLNFFFLKFVLFIPTTHWLAYVRTITWVLISVPSAVELNAWAKASSAVSPRNRKIGKLRNKQSFLNACPSCVVGILGLVSEIAFYTLLRGDLFSTAAATPITTLIFTASLIYATIYAYIKM